MPSTSTAAAIGGLMLFNVITVIASLALFVILTIYLIEKIKFYKRVNRYADENGKLIHEVMWSLAKRQKENDK